MKEAFVNAFLAPARLVWEAELHQPLEMIKAKRATTSDIPRGDTAVIGVTGQLRGHVRYEFGSGTGLAVASSMMDEQLEQHNDISMSALGEIANVISGNASANLYELGFECEITPPDLYNFGTRIPDNYIGIQIIVCFSSEIGRLNIRIGLSETSQGAKPIEEVLTVSDDSPLEKYPTRIQDVLGFAPAKRRF